MGERVRGGVGKKGREKEKKARCREGGVVSCQVGRYEEDEVLAQVSLDEKTQHLLQYLYR